MHKLYVIECRKPDGSLDFSGAQPEQTFGPLAITGISEMLMANVVFHFVPGVTLDGRELLAWPAKIDPRWRARLKTW